MNIPDNNFIVRVGPFDCNVVYRSKATAIQTKDSYGTFDSVKMKITIDRKLNGHKDQLENTVIHEIFHALWYTNGLDAIAKNMFPEKISISDLEELFVERFATSFQQFMKDNPDLF